jgi:hypothetical protein
MHPTSLHDFEIPNLLVGGCSFTEINDRYTTRTWPFYLKHFGMFKNLIDCSCSGAGNRHISDSVMLKIEQESIAPEDTLVIVMWSGYDRDDLMVDPQVLKNHYPSSYQYAPHVNLGMSGGLGGESNIITGFDAIKKLKSHVTRSYESFVTVNSLYHYLVQKGFRFVFTEFSTPGTLTDNNCYEPTESLPENLAKKFQLMLRELTPNLGDFSLKNNGFSSDNYHPSATTHATWCRNILIPHLQNKFTGK